MSGLNDALKKIRIVEVLIVIIALTCVLFLFKLFNFELSDDLIYLGVIIYFAYRLRFYGEDFKEDIKGIFSKISPKSLATIVLVNVFFSYGMIYLSIYALKIVPGLDSFIGISSLSMSIGQISGFLPILSTVIISPISEELLFRGVFLNRLNLVVPTTFAILVTSIIFGLLHDYSNIISAVVFGICMCIIYIKTQNIFVCILAHFINNLLAEIIFFLDSENLIFTNDVFIILISILAVVSFYLIIKSIHTEWKHIK